jgi:hypothetical protein
MPQKLYNRTYFEHFVDIHGGNVWRVQVKWKQKSKSDGWRRFLGMASFTSYTGIYFYSYSMRPHS